MASAPSDLAYPEPFGRVGQPQPGQGTGQQPSQPQSPRSLRELVEDYIRRFFDRLFLYEQQMRAVTDWMYKWDAENQRWRAKAVGAMSEEEKQRLRAEGYMTYDEAAAFARRTYGIVSPVDTEVYRAQLTPLILQQLATEHGLLIPLLQILAQVESAEARGGGGGFLDFLGKLIGIFLPIIKK